MLILLLTVLLRPQSWGCRVVSANLKHIRDQFYAN